MFLPIQKFFFLYVNTKNDIWDETFCTKVIILFVSWGESFESIDIQYTTISERFNYKIKIRGYNDFTYLEWNLMKLNRGLVWGDLQ